MFRTLAFTLSEHAMGDVSVEEWHDLTEVLRESLWLFVENRHGSVEGVIKAEAGRSIRRTWKLFKNRMMVTRTRVAVEVLRSGRILDIFSKYM